jgi:hypothetical protein
VTHRIRERILRKNVKASDLITVKDFLRFHTAANKSKVKEKIVKNINHTKLIT